MTGYEPGDTLQVTINGYTREVRVEEETADGLLLVSYGDTRHTVGAGEVDQTVTRELTFGVYPDADGPFAVMNQERPDIPVGTLTEIQDHVDEAISEGRLTVDGELPEAGRVTYEPGKADGVVRSIELTD